MQRNVTRDRLVRDSLLAVVASLILYRLMFTSLLFTVPLLVSASKFENKKAALLPVAVVFLAILCGELFSARNVLGKPVASLILSIGLFIPMVLLVAAAVWIWFCGTRSLVRYLASCAFAVVAGIGLVAWLQSGSETVRNVRDLYASTFKTVFDSFLPTNPALLASEGAVDAAAETSILGVNADVLFALSMQVVYRSFVPMCMAFIGVSVLLAESMTNYRNIAWQNRVALWRLPEETIWVFLGAWTLVLVSLLVPLPGVVEALVMNLALSVSLLYLVQGMSIILFLIRKRYPQFTVLRMLVSVAVALMLPGVNALVILALPLLGALETWIIFRKND